ncbi:unnamed protein product [Lathyrus sativus]|nr:unnamed protein product [Lathyrus sativus]
MDANSAINNSKNLQMEGNVESNSRLSDLPDEILQKILSNLPTKEAVATSVLSKRMVDQWMNINKIDLNFDESAPEKRQRFIEFIDKLLVVLNISKLKIFSLSFEVGEEFPMVNKWLSVFANSMIEELNLELERVTKPLVLPNHFFTSNKLTKFQLSMRQVMNLPSTIHFENLVTLTLKHVIFPNSHSTSEFFSNLPSMKELSLIDCNWKKVESIFINCPLLQKLFVRDWKDDDNEEEEHDHDVVLQHRNYSYIKIAIMASKLVTFIYDGDLIHDYALFNTTSATDATIEAHEQHNKVLAADYYVYTLLKELFTVKKLSISNFALEALGQTSSFAANLSIFFRLLVLHVISSSPMDLSCQGLQALLRISPILEEIVFELGVMLDESGANAINLLPTCFLTHLKIIKIYNFCGNEEEINAIKYLLNTTLVLDLLYIQYNESHFDSPEGSEKLQRFFDQIDEFPKLSRDCVIEIE